MICNRTLCWIPGVVFLVTSAGTLAQTGLDSAMERAIDHAIIQLEHTLEEVGHDSTIFPSETEPPGHPWVIEGYKSWDSWWTSGYFPACYWYMYRLTGQEKWRTYAEKWTLPLESQKLTEDFSNIADIIYFSFGNGLKFTKDAAYIPVIDQAASTYIKLFDPEVGAVKCWGGTWSGTRFAVVTDIMIDNEFLFLAYQLTGNREYYDVVTSHIEKTINYNLREDGSCWQFVDFDVFGDPVGYINTHAYQGAPDGTRWSRAHAWAINGLTQAYRYNRRQLYLDAAVKVADFFVSHLPGDFVPPSDFDLPESPENGRDAAAAAIACSGLYELAIYSGNQKHRQYADSIMLSLCSPAFLSVQGPHSSILARGQVRYTEPEKGLIYADAFFLEALLKYKGLYDYFLDGKEPINIPPVARAGLDRTYTDVDQDGSEIITLDGSHSYDPDGTIVHHEWQINGVVVDTGTHLTDTLSIGIHQAVLTVTDNFGKVGQDTCEVTILADHTMVPGMLNTGRIRVYPNPAADGKIILEPIGFTGRGPVKVQILEITGKTVAGFTIDALTGNPVQLDLQDQLNGLYLIRLQQDGLETIEKVVIK